MDIDIDTLKINKNQRFLNFLPKISERLNISESDLINAINRKIISHDTYKNQKYILFKKNIGILKEERYYF